MEDDENFQELTDALGRFEGPRALSLEALSQSLTYADPAPTAVGASASASADMVHGPTFASAEADLAHYRELSGKLRFLWVEQATKEKLIRALVGDTAAVVAPVESAALAQKNMDAKAALQARKAATARVVAEVTAQARALSTRYRRIRADAALVTGLPEDIRALQARVEQLRAAQPGVGRMDDASRTLAQIRASQAQLQQTQLELSSELERMNANLSQWHADLYSMNSGIRLLEERRADCIAAMEKAQKQQEATLQSEDDLANRGRWLIANETVLNMGMDWPDP